MLIKTGWMADDFYFGLYWVSYCLCEFCFDALSLADWATSKLACLLAYRHLYYFIVYIKLEWCFWGP